MSDALADHPAAQAWRRARPDASPVRFVEQLTKMRPSFATPRRIPGMFRLHHDQDPGVTIAKRRPRDRLETELLMYQLVLPQLPVRPVRCLGFIVEEDSEHAWLFLADVGGDPYQKDKHEHRICAGRWLGTLHASGMKPSVHALVPDRGPNDYLRRLRSSCGEIEAQLRCEHFSGDDRRIMLAILHGLAALESRWGRIEAWCDALPRTLVHGDFVGKNCRVRKPCAREPELVAFDWEMAGWGVPATDLATNAFGIHGLALDLEAYGEVVRPAWPDVSHAELEAAARIGDVQRVIAAIRWTCDTLVVCPVNVQDELRFYLPALENAVRLVSSGVARRPHNRAALAEGAQVPAS